jgi:patatin-related protein
MAGPPDDHGPASARPARRELRLALAMRGGVSLAVWIGGAVSEIERLRRARHPAYREMLDLAGYEAQVLVDVLAGASAGGLNGAIYAAAQVNQFPMSALRDLWIELGDLEALSRASTSAKRARESFRTDRNARRAEAVRPPSLLDGDAYFYPSLRKALYRQMAGESPTDAGSASESEDAPPKADRVDLLLSATLFAPADVRVRVSPQANVRDSRSSALFHFRHTNGESSLRGAFGDNDDKPESTTDVAARLAMAARSTSSFPVAFEPARISADEADGPDKPTGTDGLVFKGSFIAPPTATAGDVAEVIDGGVLDNIPVSAAIRAIVDAPADGPTKRWLLYLHPSPPNEPDDTVLERSTGATLGMAKLGSPRAFATLIRTLATRGQESLLTDVDELLDVNDAARRRRAALHAIFAEFQGSRLTLEALEDNRAHRRRELDAVMTGLDARLVLSALRRPEDTVAAGAAYRQALAGWSAESELALRDELQAQLGGSDERLLWTSPVALRDGTSVLVGWARALENGGTFEARRERIGAIKAAAYRLRLVIDRLECEQLVHWTARAAARVAENTSGQDGVGSLPDWVSATLASLPCEAAGMSADALGRSLCTAVDDDEPLAQLLDGLRIAAPAGGADLRRAIWTCMLELAERLRKAAPRRNDVPGPADVPFAILEQSKEGTDELVRAFEAIVAQYVPLRLVGAAPDNEIDLALLTGNSRVARDLTFAALLEQRRDGDIGVSPSLPLRPEDKLCGDELGNFAAFLSAKWRANDWMWGRMDAAATLVDLILDDPERVRAGRSAADVVSHVEAALTEAPLSPNALASQGATDAEVVPAGDPTPTRAGPGWAETLRHEWDRPRHRQIDDGEEQVTLAEWLTSAYQGDTTTWAAAMLEVREALLLRLQLEILAEELPVVAAVEERGEPVPPALPVAQPNEVMDEVKTYAIGLQRPGHLGDERRVALGMRLGLVGFGVLRPDGSTWLPMLGRAVVSFLKPAYLAALFVVCTLRRGIFVAAAAIAALLLTFWQAERDEFWSLGSGEGSAPGWWRVIAGAAVFLLLVGGGWRIITRRGQRGARHAREASSGRATGVTLVGAVLGVVAAVSYLWQRGGQWATLCLAGAILAVVAVVRWLQWARSPARQWGQVRQWIWYPATVVVVVVGAIGGAAHWTARTDPSCIPNGDVVCPITTEWDHFAVPFWVLAGIAVVVTVVGTFWMRWEWHLAVAPVLTLATYLAVARPFRSDGAEAWPTWFRVLTAIAAVCLPLVLTALAVRDVVHRLRACREGGLEILGRAAVLVVAGTLAAGALLIPHVSWGAGTWAMLAIVAAGFTLAISATYVDVFPGRPGLRYARPLPARVPAR